MNNKIESRHWTKTGWFNAVVETPPDWNLGAVSGEESEGYFRVDSPEGAAVEVRWRTQKGAVNLENILEQYIKKLKKSSRKTKIPLEVSRKPKALQGIRPAGRKPVTFGWTGDRRAQGAVWACPICDRIVIAQVVWPLDKAAPPTARILDSVRDHPEDGLATWALYDLEAKIPEQFKISKHKLMSGYIQLELVHKSSKLIVERWGLANIALKDVGIAEWIRDKSRELMRQYQIEELENSVNGHPGVIIQGSIRGIVRRVRAFVQAVARRDPPGWLSTVAWHCPDANRIFAVTGVSPKEMEIARKVAESIICHR